MCVTWFMVNKNPELNNYRLVLVFNRDEFFNKPTCPADFLDSNEDVLCGVDMTPGREGGTWLGISKTGKVACLLNIRETVDHKRKVKGRGSLVTDFLTGDTVGCSYMKQLSGSDYRGFNLVTMDFRHAKPDVFYYSNKSESEPILLDSGVYGISNTVLSQPWPKATYGKEYLHNLLNDNPVISPEELTKKLMVFALKEEGSCDIPPGISFETSELVPQKPFFKSPEYGTRTTTVILIDSKGEITFTEKTMVDPMNSKTNWSSKMFKINFPCDTSRMQDLAREGFIEKQNQENRDRRPETQPFRNRYVDFENRDPATQKQIHRTRKQRPFNSKTEIRDAVVWWLTCLPSNPWYKSWSRTRGFSHD